MTWSTSPPGCTPVARRLAEGALDTESVPRFEARRRRVYSAGTAHAQIVATAEHTYTAVFEPAEEGGYVVSFPATPCIATQGETLEEAREMAANLPGGYLEILREDRRPF